MPVFPYELEERILNFLRPEECWRVRAVCRAWNAHVMSGEFRGYRRVAILAARLGMAIRSRLAETVALTLMYDIEVPRFLPFRSVVSRQLDYLDMVGVRLPRPLQYLYMSVGGQDCVIENVPMFSIPLYGGKNIEARMLPIKFLVNTVMQRKPGASIPFAEVTDDDDGTMTYLSMGANGEIIVEGYTDTVIIERPDGRGELYPLMTLLDVSARSDRLIM